MVWRERRGRGHGRFGWIRWGQSKRELCARRSGWGKHRIKKAKKLPRETPWNWQTNKGGLECVLRSLI
jgi:hypothetical protein